MIETLSSWWDYGHDWANANTGLLFGLAAASLLGLVATALLVPLVIGRLPEDEFCERRAPKHRWHGRHPAWSVTLRVLRDVIGVFCVLAGIAMLVLPGQGLLTIFVGLLLTEFPGKRRLVLQIVNRRLVQQTLNWIRKRRGAPEFRFANPQSSSRKDRLARDDAKSAAMTISADRATKKNTSS